MSPQERVEELKGVFAEFDQEQLEQVLISIGLEPEEFEEIDAEVVANAVEDWEERMGYDYTVD